MSISHFTSRIIYALITAVLLALAFYNIFYGLSDFPIFSWDEARHGVSAYEMLKKDNFIVNTYKNKIDYWNLKPPLSFLITIAGYKLAGFNTLGLRLLSATFALLTILMIFLFVLKKHGILASFISTLSLVTSTQFLINHSARTADADSLFVFLFTSSVLSLLLSEHSIKWLYVSAATFSLGFLTKSWHSGNIFIITFLYLIFSGTYKRLTFKNWILIMTLMVGPIMAWGLLRFQYDGIEFFKNMIMYDLLKRSSTTIEGHFGSRFYYLEVIWKFSRLWVVLLIGLILANIYVYYKRMRLYMNRYIIGLGLWLFIPFILYSLAETKIRWYILPIYPAISIVIGILGANTFQKARIGLKMAIIVSILWISTNYEQQIAAYINHPIPKYHLNLVQDIQKITDVKGYNLYIYQHTKNIWAQNTVLAAELYGDLKVKDGGLKAFLKKDRALLLLKKTKKTNQLIKSKHLMIVTSNKWGYIVRKSASS
jgi:4-amino-4-deoxy-L-arabinose transferase-like glycosyltransferase